MGVPIPNGKLGMWLFLGTEIMFFTALIGTYIVLRLGSKGWPTDTAVTHITIWAGGTNTFVLITSSVFVVLAHEAMAQRNYKRVTNWMIGTMALSCVFLGIKSYEYYGKIKHDILPGHVAESPRQALDKLVRELDAASGLPALQEEATVTENLVAQKQGKDDESLKKDRDAVQRRIKILDPVVALYRPFRDKVKYGQITLAEAETGLDALKKTGFKGLIETKENELKLLDEGKSTQSGSDEFKQLKSTKLEELSQLVKSERAFGAVHEPHVMKWGNTFASVYFTMTGFHALHVVIGMIMFGLIIWLGKANKLAPRHEVFVENCGLYWHFVDLVWIFLFPLIYIV